MSYRLLIALVSATRIDYAETVRDWRIDSLHRGTPTRFPASLPRYCGTIGGCIYSRILPVCIGRPSSCCLSIGAHAADCEVTIAWANESACSVLAQRSERWFGGALHLASRAEFSEPAAACHPLDNPRDPNEPSNPPEEGFGWVTGPYSEPDTSGKRARTIVCSSAEGVAVDDSYCVDPTASPGEIWKPGSSTTSRPMLGAIALIDRGLCAFISKAQMVELSGAIAAVVVDTQDRGKEYSGLNRPSADALQVGIPLIFLSKVPGDRLKQAVLADPELRITIDTHMWVAEGPLPLLPHRLRNRYCKISQLGAAAVPMCRNGRSGLLVHDRWPEWWRQCCLLAVR